MNFTREPIIETIITPKEGCRLIIRNSKGGSQEEYSVDAIEVVSFGQSMFFRSQERPKSFLLPVTDYEVVESKETRVVLKNAPLEGSVKIGGGKLSKPVKEVEEKSMTTPAKAEEGQQEDSRLRRRKSLSRRRRLGDAENHGRQPSEQKSAAPTSVDQEKGDAAPSEKKGEEVAVPPVMFRTLIPPPPGLISEKLQHEKYQQYPKKSIASENKPQEVPADAGENIVETAVEKEVEEVKAMEFDEEPKEETSSSEGSSIPRYHAAPRSDFDGPSFRVENNFIY